jgi:hypothetical protein
MNPMDVLQPNYMGDELKNLGADDLTRNYGIGVAEANPEAAAARLEKSTNASKDKLRTQKAREFGQTKETVGF